VGTGGANFTDILLIAGPGGCGKSTLIDALRARRLAGSPLPEDAWAWPETCAKDIACGDLPVPAIAKGLKPEGHSPKGLGPKGHSPKGLGPKGLGPKGLIVHYDTMRVLTQKFADHGDDPAIKFIASAKGPLFAVTVACPRERLFAQFLTRAVVRSDGMEPARGRVARLKRSLRHLRASAFGLPRISLSRLQVALLAIYGSDRRFFQWTHRWEAYLDRLAAARGDVHRLIAVPVPGPDGAPSFTLFAAPAFQATPLEAEPLEAAPLETNWRASA